MHLWAVLTSRKDLFAPHTLPGVSLPDKGAVWGKAISGMGVPGPGVLVVPVETNAGEGTGTGTRTG